jgi:hypothetical protein
MIANWSFDSDTHRQCAAGLQNSYSAVRSALRELNDMAEREQQLSPGG